MTPKPCQYAWVRAARRASYESNNKVIDERPKPVQDAMYLAALDACWTDTKSDETVGKCWREMYEAARLAGAEAYRKLEKKEAVLK